MAAIALNTVHRPHAPQRPDRHHAAAMIEQKTEFAPLEPNVVSASIPAFFIGRNRAGFWVARESRGRVGGLFLLKHSAVDFARQESQPLRCALIFPTETFELDLENRGNSLIGQFACWIGHARRRLAQLVAR